MFYLWRAFLSYPLCKNIYTKGFFIMRKINKVSALVLTLLLAFFMSACGNNATGLWENAKYLKDTQIGSGAKTVQVEVKAEDKAITLTVKTDKGTLGDALVEYGIIAGEESTYGLYVKVVNGITADYDTDKAYWAFYQNGEYMMTGVDGTQIEGGEHYELVYTKG